MTPLYHNPSHVAAVVDLSSVMPYLTTKRFAAVCDHRTSNFQPDNAFSRRLVFSCFDAQDGDLSFTPSPIRFVRNVNF
jgi:hypothetical protein